MKGATTRSAKGHRCLAWLYLTASALASWGQDVQHSPEEQDFESVFPLVRSSDPAAFTNAETIRDAYADVTQTYAWADYAHREGIAELPDVRLKVAQLLRNEVVRLKVDEQVKRADITDADVAAYYRANRETIVTQTSIAVQECRILTSDQSPTAIDEALKQAQDLLAKAQAECGTPELFSRFISEHSQGEDVVTRQGFRDFPLHSDGRAPSPYSQKVLDELAVDLRPGRFVGPATDGRGAFFLRIHGVQAGMSIPFEDVRESLRTMLYRQQWEQRLADLEEDVLSQNTPPLSSALAIRLQSDALRAVQPSAELPPMPSGLSVPSPTEGGR